LLDSDRLYGQFELLLDISVQGDDVTLLLVELDDFLLDGLELFKEIFVVGLASQVPLVFLLHVVYQFHISKGRLVLLYAG